MSVLDSLAPFRDVERTSVNLSVLFARAKHLWYQRRVTDCYGHTESNAKSMQEWYTPPP